MNSKTAFVSTAIPYVNAKPHIGHALEIVQADVIARYLRMTDYDTFSLTGTDENSLKNVRAALELGIETKELCHRHSEAFRALVPGLNIANSDFIRTSEDIRHILGAQKFWQATCQEDIYKKHYSGLYCVGCEDFYTDKDVPDGVCPEHGTPLETVEEENYFFRLSAYQEALFELIDSGRLRIVPSSRQKEMLSFIKGGLRDFSISRSRKRAGDWGIAVPDDTDQVMYVWYDALTNYITALDYAQDGALLQKYWNQCDKRIHVIGKGINRFHSIYWPAMLMSAGVSTPDIIFVHGYLTVNGEKISKSLGNAINPLAQVKKHGIDAVRYFLLRGITPFDDGDFSEKRLCELYNSDLANNLGNLCRRLETFGERIGYVNPKYEAVEAPTGFHEAMEDFRFHDASASLLDFATQINQRIDNVKPWALLKKNDTQGVKTFLDETVIQMFSIAYWLQPFLPDAAERLCRTFQSGKKLERQDVLFPRL